jgi:23S rRNA (cytidine1920-2'-O)/16S rRNA (cytidine1409-2'-O)-methyltransferase
MPRKTFREIVEALKASSKPLRGSVKLVAALDAFGVDVVRKVCLDVGASTGGFTTVLLERGAARVYAVDAGHGQLLGSLRQDSRVVNLESTNVGELDRRVVVEPIEVVTVDVSYLPLGRAVAQLDRVGVVPGADLIGLVKPMFELGLGTAPTDDESLERAADEAVAAIAEAGWEVVGRMRSPALGARGAIEGFVHARMPADL